MIKHRTKIIAKEYNLTYNNIEKLKIEWKNLPDECKDDLDSGCKQHIWEFDMEVIPDNEHKFWMRNMSLESPPPPSPFPQFLKELEMKKYGKYIPIDWEKELDEYQNERRRRLSKRNYSGKKTSIKRYRSKSSKRSKSKSRKRRSSRKYYRRSYKRKDGTRVRSTYVKCR